MRAALETPGEGRVLVVDGNASSNCAFLGDLLAALGTHPKKSLKRGLGERDIPVRFGGVEFRPGDCLYADPDGIVVTSGPVS